MTYRPWNVSFDTPEDLYDKMLEYLHHVKITNASQLRYIHIETGIEYETVEELEAMNISMNEVETFVHRVPLEERIRPTMYGFSAYCNLGSKALWHYSKYKGDEFKDLVEWFKNILQADIEQILVNPTTRNTNGPKFVAVNNFGWSDKSEVNHVGAAPVTFVNDLDDEVK